MNQSNKLLSDVVAFRTYSKYLPTQNRRESLEETINRNMVMHLDRYPKLSKDIVKAFERVHDLKAMPSMRALQFGGEAILKNNLRSYNCSFLHINDPASFGEALFLLLSGTGVGYSVQSHHVNQLPVVQKPREEGPFLVHDSIAGWAQALETLMQAYFYGRIRPQFDYSQVRAKGAYLVTTGSKAPGPEPLKQMLQAVEAKLKTALERKLSSLEVHDVICIIADCVLAGGIRRAALISLFDSTDQQLLTSKHGEWWIKHPYRARANNSAVLLRGKTTKDEFRAIYEACIKSNAGEPGFFWTNDLELGTNPCAEISLNSNQLCNLTTINATNVKDKRDWLNRVYAATLLGTLQASMTDFPFVRPIWKSTTEKEALLGVSQTGIADSYGTIPDEWLIEGATFAKEINAKYSKRIGINSAARITAIKPEGTASCVLGSSSGIHARHSDFYIRRVRMNKDDALAHYLKQAIPALVEDDVMSASGIVVSIPQESPKGAITRHTEDAIGLFDRTMRYYNNWITPGHVSGANTHNVSVTISYKEKEVEPLFDTLWKNRKNYTAVSLLPLDNSNYAQMPFEDCTKEQYDEMSKLVTEIDLKNVKELEDKTERMDQLACVGGICELNI